MTTDADGWIEHDGKGMPVDGGTWVWVRFRKSGTEIGPNQAGEWRWTWVRPGGSDITHYRIVDEARPDAVDPVWSTSVGQTSAIREIDHFLSEEASGFVDGISKTQLRHWRAALAAATKITDDAMTVWDHYAMAALTGLLAANAICGGSRINRAELAADAGRIADAMMTERAK